VTVHSVKCRVYSLGWDIQRAFDTPVRTPKPAKPKVINAPRRTQAQHSSVNGPRDIMRLCEERGIWYGSYLYRVKKRGWSPEKALSTPFTRRKPKRDLAELKPLCAAANLPIHIVNARIHIMNWSLEKALSTPVGAIKRGRKRTKN
jgi:hypothetical protein